MLAIRSVLNDHVVPVLSRKGNECVHFVTSDTQQAQPTTEVALPRATVQYEPLKCPSLGMFLARTATNTSIPGQPTCYTDVFLPSRCHKAKPFMETGLIESWIYLLDLCLERC